MATTEMKVCPYCAEDVKAAATVCPHCRKDIGPGHKIGEAGKAMQNIGCALTLLITVPILLMLMIGMCG